MATITGRGWAYIGAILGGTMSIAANVAHSYVPPAGASHDWSPPVGAVIAAMFWPIALFVATEILARVAWPTGRGWALLRFGGLLPVSLVAALVSYKHLAGLLAFYREDAATAMFGPLAIDGLMVMATGALVATGRRTTALAEDIAHVTAPAPAATEMPPAPAVTTTPTKRVTPRPASAAKVAKVAAKMPGAPVAEIAAKAGVSPSTARRHLAAMSVTDASPSEPSTAETPTLAAA